MSSEQNKMGSLITTFLLILIGLSLTGTVQATVDTAVATGLGKGNVTGAAAAMVRLVPMFWVIIIISIGAAAIYVQIKG